MSGGASLGAVQVGMASALLGSGIRPDFIVGTSVGAVNGAWIAGERPIEGLVDLWKSLRTRDIFPVHPLLGLRGFLGRSSHLVPNSGLKRLLKRNTDYERLEDFPIPLSVIATEVASGLEVRLSEGPAVEAILASAAIPAVFPPVKIGGRTYMDGAIVDNTPITQAIEAGATEVWVLSTGFSCALVEPPVSAVAMAAHALAMLVEQRFALEVERRNYPVPVHLVPPPCPVSVSPVDFSQSAELIERAREETLQWIENGEPFALPLVGHTHDS